MAHDSRGSRRQDDGVSSSSIDILLPQLDDLIGQWWNQTIAAADGMPPHITLLWPWKSADDITDDALADLAAEVQARIGHRLPLRLDVADIAVSVEGAASDGCWAPVKRFALGSP
jgi:hypothetical protein